ncbi:MAG: coproporphyrinogen III oxidase, partial [Xanthomonadaceae bacterium]|nr:coproporphyrinogen III oxidase [Xanthomonadaceae bacterium]
DNGHLPIARGLSLSMDDLDRREAIAQLMCYGELDMLEFGARRGVVFSKYFAAELQRLRGLAGDGLVALDERTIRVTPRGRLLLRIVAMCFDAYPGKATPGRFSRAL